MPISSSAALAIMNMLSAVQQQFVPQRSAGAFISAFDLIGGVLHVLSPPAEDKSAQVVISSEQVPSKYE